MKVTNEDVALVQRIRQRGRRHEDGCLDVFGDHLRDEPFSDEVLFLALLEMVRRQRLAVQP